MIEIYDLQTMVILFNLNMYPIKLRDYICKSISIIRSFNILYQLFIVSTSDLIKNGMN